MDETKPKNAHKGNDQTEKVIKKIIISYPYGGFKDLESYEKFFLGILETAIECDSDHKPIIIFNKDTSTKKRENSGGYLKDSRTPTDFKLIEMLSTDTCVMWLRGWEEVIKYADKNKLDKNNVRAIIIPGDIQIKRTDMRNKFIARLHEFCSTNDSEFIVGDYSVDNDSAKELIDKHGTYPFLAIWFPKFYKQLITKKIKRPRSEFLNIKLSVLEDLIIGPRKFSYEQTIVLLHRYSKNDGWEKIKKKNLGKVSDEKGFRAMLGVMEQIERMERMIKLHWRDEKTNEIRTNYNVALEETPQPDFINDLSGRYERLDRKSNLIRKNSIITIQAMLDWLDKM